MDLSILFVNDVHGYLESHPELFYEGAKEVTKVVGGYARIAGYIRKQKNGQKNVLVFDGGDTFHGTMPVVQSKGEVVVPVLNRLGLTAMVGHWDFAYGPEQLMKLASQLNYPVLGINVYQEDGRLFLPPYLLMEVDGLRIAVIGICSAIIDKTMPKRFSEGLKITDGEAELPAYIEKVKAEGANLVILLSHNGFPQDCELLSKTEGVDICLSAHTHSRLYEAVTVNNSIIIQCGCHGSFLGHLDVVVEDNAVVAYNYQLKPVDESFPVDRETEALIDAMLAPYASLQNEVVGTTPQILHRYNILNSGMDNLLLAAIQWQAGTDLAFSNGWRYGIPIPKGPITKNDLFNIIPHNPVISTVELTGKEIHRLLEENLERTFATDPMKQMGGYAKRCMGLTAYIKIENPGGHRIQQLFIGNKPSQEEKIYTAVFVTEQGVPEKYGSNRHQTEFTAVDAMTRYLEVNKITRNIIQRKTIIAV